jgi:SAM-dependent methyltransferase
VTQPVYDTIGRGYVAHRREDPRWESAIAAQLGPGRSVVNVGAGTGSYEPSDRSVVAVEPSLVMLNQRAPNAAPVLRAGASALPLRSRCVDVVMAVLTTHHWDDWEAGLTELCRVAPRRVVVAIDFEPHSRFWLYEDYLPELGAAARLLRPDAATVVDAIGATVSDVLPVPADMEDGVLGAYWRRPEAYLDPAVRANCSGLALAVPAVIARGVAALESDLHSGAWHDRHADLLERESVDLGYRLLVSDSA